MYVEHILYIWMGLFLYIESISVYHAHPPRKSVWRARRFVCAIVHPDLDQSQGSAVLFYTLNTYTHNPRAFD